MLRRIILASVVFLFIFSMVGQVFADSSITRDTDSTPGASVPTTGTKLSMYKALFAGLCSFGPSANPNPTPLAINWPANSAFFVRHGWINSPLHPETNQTEAAFERPTTDFELYVDHVQQQALPDFSSGNGFHIKLFVINFPNGLTGTHLFQGWWFLDSYLIGGTPNTQELDLACSLQVTFV